MFSHCIFHDTILNFVIKFNQLTIFSGAASIIRVISHDILNTDIDQTEIIVNIFFAISSNS